MGKRIRWLPRGQENQEERFWLQVHKARWCWEWTGALHQGYGTLKWNGRNSRAHRVVYELLVGPIPEGLSLDHLCHNRSKTCPGGEGCLHRRCVNPHHLEPVPHHINVRRASVRKTTCPLGHPYNGINANGRRSCSICILSSVKEYQSRLAAGTQVVKPRERTHCRNGHLLDGSVLITKGGGRSCLVCQRAKNLARYYRQKENR